MVTLVTGCQTLPHIFGKNSKNVSDQQDKVSDIDTQLNKIKETKLQDIAVIATGTDYSLNKVTNPPPAVVIAKNLNQRVISEAGYQPSVEELKTMQKMVDNLIETNKLGQIKLLEKDKIIQSLRDTEKKLLTAKQIELDKLNDLAALVAGQADANQAELNKYTKWFGLGAILYGTIHFIKASSIALIIFFIVFMVLRIAAASNPIANLVFGIFQSLIGSFIHLLEIAVPGSITVVKQATSDVQIVSSAIVNTVNSIKPPVPPPNNTNNSNQV